MKADSPPTRHRGLTAVAGAMALIAVLLIVQIWLLTASLESFLAGHRSVGIPAAIASGIILLSCLGLYFFILRVDSEVRSK